MVEIQQNCQCGLHLKRDFLESWARTLRREPYVDNRRECSPNFHVRFAFSGSSVQWMERGVRFPLNCSRVRRKERFSLVFMNHDVCRSS